MNLRMVFPAFLLIMGPAFGADIEIRFPEPKLDFDTQPAAIQTLTHPQERRKLAEEIVRNFNQSYREEFVRLNPRIPFPLSSKDLDDGVAYVHGTAPDEELRRPFSQTMPIYLEFLNKKVIQALYSQARGGAPAAAPTVHPGMDPKIMGLILLLVVGGALYIVRRDQVR